MNLEWKIIGEAGFEFYGKMFASLSHEIKNSLAVINENAGLLQDFAHMAKGGKPLDPERLASLGGKIMEQIKRADSIVKNMNRLAHSVDEPARSIDLQEFIEYMIRITERLTGMKGVSISSVPPEEQIRITTHPFFLENLIWRCIDFAAESSCGKKTIKVGAEMKDNDPVIRFSDLEGLSEASLEEFPSEQEKALLTVLNSRISIDAKGGEMHLLLSDQGKREDVIT
ncbi:MAG: sensor histidine kinase [Deltaproteobacteria bacterium]|nr:sensor histidine kinase [Deltaproteobacteria bacterium]